MAHEEDATRTNWKIGFVLITVLGLTVRAAVFACFGDSFETRGSSAGGYDRLAKHIVEGRGFTVDGQNPDIWMFPGYVYFLAGIYGTIGNSALVVSTVHTLLTALTGVFVFLTGWKIVGVRVGLLACLSVNLSPWLALMTMALTDGALVAMLVSASFLVACLMLQSSRWCWVVWAGVVTGLAILVRSSVQVLVPLVVIGLFWKGGARQWKRSAVYILLIATILTPWIVRNWRLCGRFISLSMAQNSLLWDGNNPQTATFIREFKSFDLLSFPHRPSSDAPHDVLQASLSNRADAIRFMREHPWETALLTVRKFFLFYSWSYWPHSMLASGGGEQEVSQLHLRSLVYAWSTRPLLILALIGGIIGGATHRELSLLTIFLIVVGLGHAVLQAQPRYRVPFDPLLGILAAYALVWMWDQRLKTFFTGALCSVSRSLGLGRERRGDSPSGTLHQGTGA